MRCRQARKNGPRSVSVCPATLLFIGRRALLRSEASMRRRQDLGWTFRLGTRWASGRKARGGVLELTLGCGGRAQSQRAGGNRGKRKSRRLGEQAPRRSIGKCEVRRLSAKTFVWPSSFAVCRLCSRTKFVPFCSTDFLGGRGVGSLSETLFVPHYVLLRGPRCLSRFVCVLSNNNNNNDRRATPTNPTSLTYKNYIKLGNPSRSRLSVNCIACMMTSCIADMDNKMQTLVTHWSPAATDMVSVYTMHSRLGGFGATRSR